jgi:YD repeat-containing protein
MSSLDVPAVVDAGMSSLDGGAPPPFDAFTGPLPPPNRDAATWGPLRVTRRVLGEGGLVPVERQVFAYSDRRLNAMDTEMWRNNAWATTERMTWAYTTRGTLDARFLWRQFSVWTVVRRWRYEYNPDGTLRVERGDVLSGGTLVETSQLTWEWVGRLPGWQRYFEAPTVGGASVRMWENAFEYDPTGRLTGFTRIQRTRPTDTFVSGGRRTFFPLPGGQLDRELFVNGPTRTERVFRYDPRGAVQEVSDGEVATRYHYDPQGRLQFVRTWSRFDQTWTLVEETEVEPTPEGSDVTFALDVSPLETWRLDRYGRGDLVDRYRR